VPFLAFVALFTVFRFANHFLRAHPGTFKLPDWFYPFLYAVVLAVTLLLIVWRIRPWKTLHLPRSLSFRDQGDDRRDGPRRPSPDPAL